MRLNGKWGFKAQQSFNLDSYEPSSNIIPMRDNLPAKTSSNLPAQVPSLARAFEPSRQALQQELSDSQTTAQIVTQTRRALDRAGAAFQAQTDDPNVQKAGLWLIEMVKAGAGVLDHGTDAQVSWEEVAPPQMRKWAGRGLFYGTAGVFALIGVAQTSGLVVICAAVLAGLRFFDPKDWGHLFSKLAFTRLPFFKSAPRLEDATGRHIQASAQVKTDTLGFINSLSDALKTADHILLRLTEPGDVAHWREDRRLMGLVQNLLEARGASDGDYALKLIDQELSSVLLGEGVEIVSYSKKTRHMFDVMPAMGIKGTQEVAPALKSGDRLLRKGTVWQGDL